MTGQLAGRHRRLFTAAFGVFARRATGKDGGERIILVTDRPLSLGESWNQSRTMDYPFTVVELHMPKPGDGDGTYGTQRIKLNQVRRERPNDRWRRAMGAEAEESRRATRGRT